MKVSRLSATLLALLAACGGGGGADCGVEAQKRFVLDTVYDQYLFLDTLPATPPSTATYADAASLLDALTATARAQGRDRGFSFLSSAAGEAQFYDEGQTVAFGLRTQLRDDRLLVAAVPASSPAAEAGFVRGDEILAIGTTPGTLIAIADLENQPGGIGAAFGPAAVGVARSFRVRNAGGVESTRSLVTRLITLNPVPAHRLLAREGLSPIGYLAFDSFITPAEAALRGAFAEFKTAGVRDLVLDLRYNGGGLIRSAEVLANLLAADRIGEPMFTTEYNSRYAHHNETTLFAAESQALPALRIAFIGTAATASASEIVINALEPYAQVALIGDRTFGKPVGQFGIARRGCDTVLRLVAFRTVNRDGDGDYYDGLPDANFDGTFCVADDQLSAPRDDLTEASLATALHWLNQGTCPAPIAKAAKPPMRYLQAPAPSAAQAEMPGWF